MKNVSVAQDVNADDVAAITPGFTGADLANLVNEAAIFATRRGGEKVTLDDFTNAVERIVAGSERKSRLLQPDERERVAYHEMGHAIVASRLRNTDPVQKISIIPRSVGALGYTMQRPTDDRFLITSSELRERMITLLAGRAAEEIIYGEISTGAADDLTKATEIARQSVTRFGMDPGLGQAVLEEQKSRWLGDGPASFQQRDYSEATAREVDLSVRKSLKQAYSAARTLLKDNIDDLHAGAKLLLERETITPAEFPPLQKKARSGLTASPRAKPPRRERKEPQTGANSGKAKVEKPT